MQERKYTSPHTFITDSDFSWDKLYRRYVLNPIISLEISHLKTKPPVCALSYLTNGPLLNGTWRKTIFFFGENRFYLCNSCSCGQWEPAQCGEKGRLAKSPKRSRKFGEIQTLSCAGTLFFIWDFFGSSPNTSFWGFGKLVFQLTACVLYHQIQGEFVHLLPQGPGFSVGI